MTDTTPGNPASSFLDALDAMAEVRDLLELIAMANNHCAGDPEASAVNTAAHLAKQSLDRAEGLFRCVLPLLDFGPQNSRAEAVAHA